MADVRAVSSEPVQQIRVSAGVDSPAVKPAAEKDKERAAKEQALENLVSRSEDGDTLQVSEQGASKLEQRETRIGMEEEDKEEKQAAGQPAPETKVERAADSLEKELAVIGSDGSGKTAEVRQEADRLKVEMAAAGQDNTGAGREIRLEQQAQRMEEEQAAKEISAMKDEISGRTNAGRQEIAVDDQADREPVSGQEEKRVDINVSSYTGISNSQLKQMYQRGEISKNDYDKEMEKREEQLESLQEDSKETSREMTGSVSAGNRVEMDAQELKAAFAENSSQTFDANQRVDIVDTLLSMGVPMKA